mgnify:CR=1 FL=1
MQASSQSRRQFYLHQLVVLARNNQQMIVNQPVIQPLELCAKRLHAFSTYEAMTPTQIQNHAFPARNGCQCLEFARELRPMGIYPLGHFAATGGRRVEMILEHPFHTQTVAFAHVSPGAIDERRFVS